MSSSVQEMTREGSDIATSSGNVSGSGSPSSSEQGARGDQYVPDIPSNLPSNAQMRAMRAEIGGSGTAQTLACSNIPRFQGAGWTAQAVLAQTPGALLGHPAQEPVAPPPGRPRSPATPTSARPSSSGNSMATLWYAQAATYEAQQKSHLTFRKIRPA